MILGILLGLLSSMLLISLAVSVFMYVKLSEIKLLISSLEEKSKVFSMFKEQALAEIIQLKTTVTTSLPKLDDLMSDADIKKMNGEYNQEFEAEYLKILEERSL